MKSLFKKKKRQGADQLRGDDDSCSNGSFEGEAAPAEPSPNCQTPLEPDAQVLPSSPPPRGAAVRSRSRGSTGSSTAKCSSSARSAKPAAAVSWEPLPAAGAFTGRRGASLCYHPEQQVVYVFGGECADGYSNALWALDTNTMKWEELVGEGDAPSPRADHVAALHGSRLFVVGGRDAAKALDDCFEFDVGLRQWSPLARAPARVAQSAALVVQQRLVLFGGWNGKKTTHDVLSFDLVSRSWVAKTPLPSRLPSRMKGHCAVLSAAGDVHLLLGTGDDGKPLSQVTSITWDSGREKWRVGEAKWKAADAPAGLPREGSCAFCHKDSLYAWAGQEGGGGACGEVFRFDLTARQWDKVCADGADVRPRWGAGALSLPPRLVVIGGGDEAGFCDDAWCLAFGDSEAQDTSGDEWLDVGDQPLPHPAAASAQAATAKGWRMFGRGRKGGVGDSASEGSAGRRRRVGGAGSDGDGDTGGSLGPLDDEDDDAPRRKGERGLLGSKGRQQQEQSPPPPGPPPAPEAQGAEAKPSPPPQVVGSLLTNDSDNAEDDPSRGGPLSLRPRHRRARPAEPDPVACEKPITSEARYQKAKPAADPAFDTGALPTAQGEVASPQKLKSSGGVFSSKRSRWRSKSGKLVDDGAPGDEQDVLSGAASSDAEERRSDGEDCGPGAAPPRRGLLGKLLRGGKKGPPTSPPGGLAAAADQSDSPTAGPLEPPQPAPPARPAAPPPQSRSLPRRAPPQCPPPQRPAPAAVSSPPGSFSLPNTAAPPAPNSVPSFDLFEALGSFAASQPQQQRQQQPQPQRADPFADLFGSPAAPGAPRGQSPSAVTPLQNLVSPTGSAPSGRPTDWSQRPQHASPVPQLASPAGSCTTPAQQRGSAPAPLNIAAPQWTSSFGDPRAAVSPQPAAVGGAGSPAFGSAASGASSPGWANFT